MKFSILGVDIPEMIGRKKLLQNVSNELDNENPIHISLIGQKYSGKTVFLYALSKHLRAGNNRFNFCVYLDLHHNLPASDADFLQLITTEILKEVITIDPEYSELLDITNEQKITQLLDFFECLEQEKKTFVLILDGIDDTLKSGSITRNLWDNLRALAKLSSIRIITGSRGSLRELCMSPQSRTSDFWNIFKPSATILGIYSDQDIDDCVKAMKEDNKILDKSAITEVINWTGKHPLLVSLLLKSIIESDLGKTTISNVHVNSIASDLCLAKFSDHIESLWDDCSLEEKILFNEHILNCDTQLVDGNKKTAHKLVSRGFVNLDNGKIKCSSRFIQKVASEKSPIMTNIYLAFGNLESYSKNMMSLLDLRLSLLKFNNTDLHDRLVHIIKDTSKPSICLTQFRGLCDYLIDEINQIEFPARQIPTAYSQHWLSEFTRKGSIGQPPLTGAVPTERSGQMRLLKNVAESRFLKKFSESTIRGIETIYNIANFGQHLGNAVVTRDFVVPFALIAIEVSNQFILESK